MDCVDIKSCHNYTYDDPNGLLIKDIPCVWINDDKGLISTSGDFTIEEQRDLLGLDSLGDESRHPMHCRRTGSPNIRIT
jgi:hypothetical protein